MECTDVTHPPPPTPHPHPVGEVSTCPSPPLSNGYHYINIFEDMLASDPDIIDQLKVAPYVQGMDVTTPAYEFAGLGSGFAITSMSVSIRKASCEYNEVTFNGRMFIRDSQSDGPLMELSYAGGLQNGLVVYLLHVDAAAGEIILGYRCVQLSLLDFGDTPVMGLLCT